MHDHAGGAVESIPLDEGRAGHGGGDEGIMADFVAVLQGEKAPLTDARTSLESHLLAFAAEEARLEHSVIDMVGFRRRADEIGRQAKNHEQ